MERYVYILGPRTLQNDLMARYLGQNTGYVCLSFSSPDQIPADQLKHPDASRLILRDCEDRVLSDCLPLLEADDSRLFHALYALLFNLKQGSAMEEPAMKLGIKGNFGCLGRC